MAGKSKAAPWLDDDGLLRIEGWARDGLTGKQIAHNIGVDESTLCKWQRRYPAISQALKKGREVVDREVENALLKRALGYDYVETKTEVFPDGTMKTTDTTKHVQGDTTAQIFWLQNRKPDDYRDRRRGGDPTEKVVSAFVNNLKDVFKEDEDKVGDDK